MALFYFDFRQNEEYCRDAIGSEFATAEEAYLEGVRAAQEMWGELLEKLQDPRRCTFEIFDADRRSLFVIPFQELLDSCKDRRADRL